MTHDMTDVQDAVEGLHFESGARTVLKMRDGRIAQVLSGSASPTGGDLPLVGPGLVDLQVNGYGGMDFNSTPLDEEIVWRVTRALWREGVTTYYPTIITNCDEALEGAVRTIARARSRDGLVESSVAGIHLEGPFISPEDGPRGAHNKVHVRAPDWSLFARWQDAAEGNIKLITLSPEWPGSTDFITKCVDEGVAVCIGHTAATSEQIREAVAAGARMSTHLGNGAHPTLPRHPNYIWEQLAQDALWASVIADGFHLPEAVLKVVLKVKGNRTVLVSDAVSFSGMEPGEYDAHVGGRVVLTPQGKLHMADNPQLLAGSVQMLRQGVEHLAKSHLSSLTEAWEMASVRPASFMYLPQADGLNAGAPADLVVISRPRDEIKVLKTYERGRLVHGDIGIARSPAI
jgi:N-acetylglucosamine-6-phosphate deacetylase